MLGYTVLYSSINGDGVKSPAIILRTQDTTVLPENIKAGPHAGGVLPEGFQLELSSGDHVDLLVHGLAKDYRMYNVPNDESVSPAPGTWADL